MPLYSDGFEDSDDMVSGPLSRGKSRPCIRLDIYRIFAEILKYGEAMAMLDIAYNIPAHNAQAMWPKNPKLR